MSHSSRHLLALTVLSLTSIFASSARADDLLVASYGYNRIDVFDGTTGIYLGVFGEADESTGIASPRGLAKDSQNNVYVASSGGQVLKYSSSGAFQGIFSDATQSVTGIAIDKFDNLYARTTNTILKYDSSGNDLGVFASGLTGTYGAYPIAIDKNNHVYAATGVGATEYQLVSFSSSGTPLGVFGDVSETSGHLSSQINAFTFSPSGNLFVLSSGDVTEYSSAGEFIGVYNDPTDNITGSGSTALGLEFDMVSGRLFVSEQTTIGYFDASGDYLGDFGDAVHSFYRPAGVMNFYPAPEGLLYRSTSAIPEPGSFALFAGLAAMGTIVTRRRHRHRHRG